MTWFRKPSKKENASEEQFDRCVICGDETRYTKDTPLNERECYVIGCGQLCFGCYKNTCEDSPLKPSESEMQYLLRACRKEDEK